jgi:phosphatidylglycerophosphatase A
MTGGGGGTWRRWFVTLGGAGMSPVAPGTMGSAVATAILALIVAGFGASGTPLSPAVWNGILVVGIVVYGLLCVGLGRWATEYYGRKDPGACVLDEGAGVCLTALFLPLGPGRQAYWVLAAVFVAFRIFDIVKLPPAKRLERLPYGWGILLDDLAAAVYANVVCQVVFRWVIH